MPIDFHRALDLTQLPVVGDEPLALLADIHANIEALAAVTGWLDQHGIKQAVVLGDLIGYGAAPNEVLGEIRRRGWLAIRGNHEDILLDPTYSEQRGGLKARARAALDWTRQHLDVSSRQFIESLPLAAALGHEMIAVHGSLVDPRRCYAYIYDLSLDLNIRRMTELALPPGILIVHGHTHQTKIFQVQEEDWNELDPAPGERRLDPASSFFINPGSVGLPRDGNPQASFMVWDAAHRSLRSVRVAYDVQSAAQRILLAGYSDEVAEYLLSSS